MLENEYPTDEMLVSIRQVVFREIMECYRVGMIESVSQIHELFDKFTEMLLYGEEPPWDFVRASGLNNRRWIDAHFDGE